MRENVLMQAVTGSALTLTEVLRVGGLRSVFQPIVDLSTNGVVGYEALARGPEGELASPDRLFSIARVEGLVAELDRACRQAAFTGAVARGVTAPLSLFVNVEPEALDAEPTRHLSAQVRELTTGLRVVVELTERALGTRPADLLRNVDRIREFGWGVALDDVGAEPLSLAFMSLLRPDVVKLDLRVVQQRPDAQVAQIMNAVNAYSERSGAVILAEGIETPRHLTQARALGATLGQGWLFGRPVADPPKVGPTTELRFSAQPAPNRHIRSPFGLLRPEHALRRAPKSLLVQVSKHLERDAARLGPTCLVAATFQKAEHFTPATAARYRDLVDWVGFVCVLGAGLPADPLPGLRSADLPPGDPTRGEWDLVVLDPHFAVALLARDLGDQGPDEDRTFEFALTYTRPTVEQAAHTLISKLVPTPLPGADHPPLAGAAVISRRPSVLPEAGPQRRGRPTVRCNVVKEGTA